jgi:NADH-quinone oxidoreductase subunit A
MSEWSLGIYFAAVIVLATLILIISHLIGERHSDPETGSPYESGILSQGSARVRLSAKFYLVAMFFVIFDLEAVFILAWAIAGRELGWPGYWAVVVFIGVLVAVLIYEWRMGALDWGSTKGRIRETD